MIEDGLYSGAGEQGDAAAYLTQLGYLRSPFADEQKIKTAVKAFQNDHGLKMDGSAPGRTLDMLRKTYDGKESAVVSDPTPIAVEPPAPEDLYMPAADTENEEKPSGPAGQESFVEGDMRTLQEKLKDMGYLWSPPR